MTDIETTELKSTSEETLPFFPDATDTVIPESTDSASASLEEESTEEQPQQVSTVDSTEETEAKEEKEAVEATAQKKDSASRNKKYDPDNPRKIDGIFDFIELFVFTLAAVLIITTFLLRYSVVDGDSMQNTLQDDEKLLISDLFYTPQRGDVIVFEDYTTVLKKPLVKRIIATEGQTVRIALDGVYVDGEKLDEPYVYTDGLPYLYDVTPKSAIRNNPDFEYEYGRYYQITVPEGELFVMGDHRSKSTDSRDIGTIRADAVLGKVILRIYPFDSFGSVD